MMEQPVKNDVFDHLSELSRILESIEGKHGTVQSFGDHCHVRELHAQARWQIAQIQEELTNGSKENKICDDRQIEERSDSTIGWSDKNKGRQASQASEVNVSLANYLAQMPDHPIVKGIEQWITSLNKMFSDVSWWEIDVGRLAPHTWKVRISVQFAGSPTKYDDVFVYTDIEYLKGMDNGR